MQALELQPDLARRLDVETDEGGRRDEVGGDRARPLDRLERDQNSTSVPSPRCRALLDAERRGGEILDGEPERLEHGQLVGVPATRMRADQQLAELGANVVGPDAGFLHRRQVVAGLVQRRLAPVDEQPGAGDHVGIELARPRDGRADGVHVRAGSEPGAAHDRLARRRARAHDVGAVERLLDRLADDGVRLERERLGVRRRAAPDPEVGVGHDRAHRLRVRPRLNAGAENRDAAEARPGEKLGGDGGDRGGPDLGDRRGVEDRAQDARLAVVEDHGALVRVEPAGGVRRRDRRSP